MAPQKWQKEESTVAIKLLAFQRQMQTVYSLLDGSCCWQPAQLGCFKELKCPEVTMSL